MLQDDTEVVRSPSAVSERTSQTLDQRLYLRFPQLAADSARLVSKLRPGSRLCRAMLSGAVVVGWHPECEWHPCREWVEVGLFEPCYRGLHGYRRFVASFDEVWGGVSVTPVELIDRGDQIAVLCAVSMRAQAAAFPLGEATSYVTTLKDGRAIRIELCQYPNIDAARRATGLRA